MLCQKGPAIDNHWTSVKIPARQLYFHILPIFCVCYLMNAVLDMELE